MAIKDWEKVSEHQESPGMSWNVEWRKGDKSVKAWRPASPAHKGFRVNVVVDRQGQILKESFASKAQAINFAKCYMRSH